MQIFPALDDIPYIVDFAQIPLPDIIRNRQIKDPLEVLLKSSAFRKIISASLSPAEGILPSFKRKELFELIISRISPLSPEEQSLRCFFEKVFNINYENLSYDDLCLKLLSSVHGLSSILNSLNIHSMHIITDIAEDLRPFNQLKSDRILKFQAVPQIDLSDYVNIMSFGFASAVKRLSAVSGNISAMADMMSAIESRIDSFYAAGAKSVLVQLESAQMLFEDFEKSDRAFKAALGSNKVKSKQAAYYRASFISCAAAACAKRNMLFIMRLPNDDEPIYKPVFALVQKLIENSSLPKMIAVANSTRQFETLCGIASCLYGASAIPAFAVRAARSVDLNFQLKTLALNNMLYDAVMPLPQGTSLIDIFSLPAMRKNAEEELCSIKHALPDEIYNSLLKDICFSNLHKLYFE